MTHLVKICGLSTPETFDAALSAGADLVALNFHPKSPRFVSLATAADLASRADGRAGVVALVVDMEDDALAALISAVRPDILQLHGSETPERAREIMAATELPVLKAIGVAAAGDLPAILPFHGAGCRILLDAKPPADAAYPGGHGRVFDWSILKALPTDLPFMLSGGLTAENVGAAIRGVRHLGVSLIGVDVSSGVERAPGLKDPLKIAAFIRNARMAFQPGQIA